MDTALASIIMCANSVKISPQESNVRIACQDIMAIQPMGDNVQVILSSFTREKKIEKDIPVWKIYFIT